MTENKTKPTSASVDDFIAAIDNPRRRADSLTALAIYKDLTGLPPVMWGPSIIGFGAHRYVYESGREGSTPAACFSPRKANMTFYVGDEFEGANALLRHAGIGAWPAVQPHDVGRVHPGSRWIGRSTGQGVLIVVPSR